VPLLFTHIVLESDKFNGLKMKEINGFILFTPPLESGSDFRG
jgi:hypothetical protein